MASFRILNQAPQYLLADGSVNNGGKLFFYETDLTTPKNTWSDEAMTTLNSNPVVMDAAGRTLTDVWGDGEYGVKMTDADSVVIWTRNNVRASEAAPGSTIPALESGAFLTNNGSSLLWEDIAQVPDPTGFSGNVLYSDGALAYWGALPEPAEPNVAVTAVSVTIDDGGSAPNKMMLQMGSDTATTGGGRSVSKSVTFATAFSSTPPFVIPVVRTSPLSAFGNMPSVAVTSKSSTGATFLFTMGELDDGRSGYDFNANVVFDYFAIGNIA